jgi:gluconolactonase
VPNTAQSDMLASLPAPVTKLWTLACLGRAFARGIAVPDSVHTSIIILSTALAAHSTPVTAATLQPGQLPAQAQLLLPADTVVLPTVLPPDQSNVSTIFVPPGSSLESLSAQPFHVINLDFLNIIGDDPSLTLIAATDSDPLFHEAVVW